MHWPAIPELCPACRGSTGGGFCTVCSAAFRRVAAPCEICGLPGPCTRCLMDSGWLVWRTFAPFEYTAPLDHYLQTLKFARGRSLGRALALLLWPTLRSAVQRRELEPQVLVPVPLHARRLRERGYNQAAEIARTLQAALPARLLPAGATRPRHAAVAQSVLDARARRANVAGAFRAGRDYQGLRVAIVDDVITTGATINALAGALLDAGAERVDAIAIARTIGPDQDDAGRSSATGSTRNT